VPGLFGHSRLLIEREEDLVALNADFFYLIDIRDTASQLPLTERLARLFRVEDVTAAERPAGRLVAVVSESKT